MTKERLSEDDLTLVERSFGESFTPCPVVPLLLTIFSFDRGRHRRAYDHSVLCCSCAGRPRLSRPV